jgi:hypothetical protein
VQNFVFGDAINKRSSCGLESYYAIFKGFFLSILWGFGITDLIPINRMKKESTSKTNLRPFITWKREFKQ